MAHEFKHRRRVEFADTDMAGIMHFSRFFVFMESAEHAFFRSLGYSIHGAINGVNYGWPRIDVQCQFKKPLKFEDDVEIHLLIDEISAKTIQYKFILRKMADDKSDDHQTVAEGLFKVICVSMNPETREMRSVAIPDEIRSKLEETPKI